MSGKIAIAYRNNLSVYDQCLFESMKKLTLVVGANGATGRLLVEELLCRGQQVRAVVRSSGSVSEISQKYEQLTVIEKNIFDASEVEMSEMTADCDAIASCLGHNISLNGLFGHPRRLVTDVTRRIYESVKANSSTNTTRFLLMNTAGNSNRDLRERASLPERCVIQLLRLVLPPHRDNELASDYLRLAVGQNASSFQWVVVRPDSLINEDAVTEYELHPSPIRGAIFNPGKTSRINVAHFMAELIADDHLWDKWRGQMPVIYNAESSV